MVRVCRHFQFCPTFQLLREVTPQAFPTVNVTLFLPLKKEDNVRQLVQHVTAMVNYMHVISMHVVQDESIVYFRIFHDTFCLAAYYDSLVA